MATEPPKGPQACSAVTGPAQFINFGAFLPIAVLPSDQRDDLA